MACPLLLRTIQSQRYHSDAFLFISLSSPHTCFGLLPLFSSLCWFPFPRVYSFKSPLPPLRCDLGKCPPLPRTLPNSIFRKSVDAEFLAHSTWENILSLEAKGVIKFRQIGGFETALLIFVTLIYSRFFYYGQLVIHQSWQPSFEFFLGYNRGLFHSILYLLGVFIYQLLLKTNMLVNNVTCFRVPCSVGIAPRFFCNLHGLYSFLINWQNSNLW